MENTLKNERLFLEENDSLKNANGAYLYKSESGNDILLLDYYLKDYKDWLIENGIVKLVE
jgi:hypothetical protein